MESETVDGLPGRGHAAQPLGVLDGDRGRRDLRRALLVVEGPRVGRGDRAAGGRAHEHRHRAQLRRRGGARAAEAHRAAVALPVGREGHDLPLDLLAPERRQLLEAPHHHDGRRDALLRRARRSCRGRASAARAPPGRRRGPTPARAPSGAPSRPAAGRPPAPRPSSPRGPRRRPSRAPASRSGGGRCAWSGTRASSRRPRPRARGRGCGRRSRGSAPPGRPAARAGAARGSRRARATAGRMERVGLGTAEPPFAPDTTTETGAAPCYDPSSLAAAR